MTYAIHLFKEIYGLSENKFHETTDYFTELFQVKKLMDVQVRTLSLGERMKMELIVALLHNPRILFLDEPTIGLDAIASRQIRTFLQKVNKERGTTILLTSHYMEDIKALCPRCVVINHGKKIYDGNTETLFENYQQNKRISATFTQLLPDLTLPGSAQIIERTPYKLVFQAPKESVPSLLTSLMQYHPADLSVEEEEIGAVVERIYNENI